MVSSEWEKVLTASPQHLNEQEKEEFFEKLAWTEIDSNLTHENLILLLRISQEVLKFKGEQIEYLVNELDTLTATQSDETGRKTTSEQTDVSQKFHEFSNEDSVKAQIKNDQLYSELQEKERDLLNEKRQVEKLTEQVTVLEQEKIEVQRELAVLQREIREFQEGKMRPSSPDVGNEKVQELTEAVRQKNKHITQLLSDIETIEKENTILKEKLSTVKEELEDATQQMTKLAGDASSLHHTVKEQQLQIDELEEQNVALRRQVSELVADKQNRDDQLDQLGLALDSRLLQWQDLLEKKDAELKDIKQQLALTSCQTPILQLDTHAKQIAALTQAIEKRDDQVEDLQKKLLQATEDLNISATVLEEYKEKLKEKNSRNGNKEPEIVRELQKQVSDLQFRLSMMGKRVEDAEREAQVKAEEVSNLIIQLREYESGQFGLNDAMEQVRELRQQKAVRDRHIEQLVQAGNQLQEEANQLEEENLALRDKLGLDVESVVRIEGVIARRQQDQSKIEELSRQVENANDSQIQLKLENRELSKTISTLQDKLKDLGLQTKIELVLPSIPEKIDTDKEKEEAQARLKEMIDENEALRRGMHEILDSIRSHDASSLIHIESEGLERLLEALDARHVSGWYHPAMRLQAQLNNLYGINAALREQLHISRENETEKLAELQRAVSRIELMEKELINLNVREKEDGGELQDEKELHNVPESLEKDDTSSKSTRLPKGAVELIEELKSHQAVTKMGEPQNIDVDQEMLKLMEKVSSMEEIMNETNERYDSDRESWQKVRTGLEKDLEVHSMKVSSMNKQLCEFKDQWETIEKGPDEMAKKIAENALRLGDLSAENETLRRKIESIQEINSRLRVEYNTLQEHFQEMELKNSELTGHLNCEKEILQNELESCRALLSESVLTSEMETIKNELNLLSGKHRGLLTKLTDLDISGRNFEKRLREELLYWQKRSAEMESELLVQKQKAIASQYSTLQETEDLAKKVAELNLKEDVNRLKVEHSEKMNNLMNEQVLETETRLKQMEHDLRIMSEQNLAAQLIEAELRNQLVHCPSTNELTDLKQKCLTLEKQLSEMKVERAKLAKEAELAKEQFSSYNGLRKISDFRYDALQREILDLTAKSDDKATIGRLTREVTAAQLHELMAKEESHKNSNRISNLEGYIRELETRNKTLVDQLNYEANNHIDKYRSLIEIIHDLHQRYVGSLPLVTIDTMGSVIAHLQKEILLMKDTIMSQNKTEMQDASLFSDDSKMKVNSRVQELNQRIEIENLQCRVKHAEEQAKRQEKLCKDIQHALIELDTSWEKKLMLWEQIQLNLLKANEDIVSESMRSPKEDIALQSTREASPNLTEQLSQSGKEMQINKSVEEEERTPQSGDEVKAPCIELKSPHSESSLQKEMIDSLNDQISQVSQSLNQETDKLTKCERRSNELVTQLQDVTNQLEDRKNQLISLKSELSQKNEQLIEKEREVMELRRAHSSQQPVDDNQDESTEILAFKTTVTSLQNIVNQKEETISRYQSLLKEAREEHSVAIHALRQEMNTLEEELNKQTLVASSRVFVEKESSRPEHVRALVEKYLCRIHELEDDMGQARDQIKQLSTQLNDCQKSLTARDQHDNLRPTSHRSDKRVEYVLKEIDEVKEDSDEGSDPSDNRKADSDDESEVTENENSKDHDRKDLKRDYNKLAEQLRDKNEQIEKLNNTIAELKHNKGESMHRERLRSELERKKRRIEMLESKVEEDKVEISRLRHQLTSRPTRPEGVGSLKEEQLLKRIRNLEEDLNEAHLREEKERECHRNKCAEEVEKWQERKRWQSINDKLRTQVKSQSTQIEALKSSQQRLRDTITRLERERNTLENKLKSIKGSIPAQSLIEDLEREVKQLKARNEFLKKTSEISSSSSLSEVIESQQRKIEALQIAQKGDSALAEEIERLQERKSQLQKINLRLEGENLKLKLELQRRRNLHPDSDGGTPESDCSDKVISKNTSNHRSKRNYEDLERAVTVFQKVVDKLQSENKRLRSNEALQLKDEKVYVEKLQMELQKAQENYMDALDKISSLEVNLKAEKENYRMVQEQLLQKARLLTKCKILLERAAIREKALNEQVSDLQKLIPPESLLGTYHNTQLW